MSVPVNEFTGHISVFLFLVFLSDCVISREIRAIPATGWITQCGLTLAEPEAYTWLTCIDECLAVSKKAGTSKRFKHRASYFYVDGAMPPESYIEIKGPNIRDHGDWTVMFRGVAGIGKNMYKFWLSDEAPEPETRRAAGGCSCQACHYKNSLLKKWETLGIKRVRVSLFRGSQEVAYVMFNGVGTNRNNWFDKNRMLASSWTDLTKTVGTNIFGLTADAGAARTFMIFHGYGGCDNDKGWMLVTETEDGCKSQWAKADLPSPAILYSKTDVMTRYGAREFGVADSLEVLISKE